MAVEISRECFSWPEISDFEEEENVYEEIRDFEKEKRIKKQKIEILTTFVKNEQISEEIIKMINLEEVQEEQMMTKFNSTHQVPPITYVEEEAQFDSNQEIMYQVNLVNNFEDLEEQFVEEDKIWIDDEFINVFQHQTVLIDSSLMTFLDERAADTDEFNNTMNSSNQTMDEFQDYEESPSSATSTEEQPNYQEHENLQPKTYYPTIDPTSQPTINNLGYYKPATSVPMSPGPFMYPTQPYQQAYTPTFLPHMMTYPCASPYYVNSPSTIQYPSPIQYTPMVSSPFGYPASTMTFPTMYNPAIPPPVQHNYEYVNKFNEVVQNLQSPDAQE